MPGYANPKWYYQLVENFCIICRQKINFFRYYKDIVKLSVLGTLGMPSYANPVILSTCRKFLHLSVGKKSTSHPCSSEDIANICKLILGNLEMPGCKHPKW